MATEGLQPNSRGARIAVSGNQRTVIDGPLSDAEDRVAGFWLWQVKYKEEAIERAKRCPSPTAAAAEIPQAFEAEDFGPDVTLERREQEEQLREYLQR